MEKGISLQEYAEAVAVLIKLESHRGTSGARCAAQVLLSAYNGSEFQLDVTDLCNLSREYLDAAMTVIRGRVETGHEPHQVVKGGEGIFHAMWDRWDALRVAERGKEVCSDCYGTGKVYVNPNNESDERQKPCRRCGGKGRYWPT